MKNWTIRYGLETINREVTNTTTITQVVKDEDIRARLGYGDNVKVLVDGIEQPGTVSPADEAEIVIETACNTKAS